MATHSSILTQEFAWTEEPGGLQSMQSQSWTRLSDSFALFVQSLCCVQLFGTPWIQHQASPSFTIPRSLLKLVSRVSDAIQPSHPLLSPSPPAFCLSQHQGLFQ